MSPSRTEKSLKPRIPHPARRKTGRQEPPKGNRRRALDYVKRGLDFLSTGNRKGGWTQFTLAVKLDPHCPEAYLEMGRYQHDLGNLTAAANFYERALEAEEEPSPGRNGSENQAFLGALIGRGVVGWQKKEWETAIQHIERAVAEGYAPSEFLRQVMGECRLRLGQIRESVVEYQKAPWSAEGLMNSALALFALGDLERAAATLRRAFFHQPSEVERLLGLPVDEDKHVNAARAAFFPSAQAGAGRDVSSPHPDIPDESGAGYAERCRDLWEEIDGALVFLSDLWMDPQVVSEMEQARRIESALRASGDFRERSLLKSQLDRLRSPVRLHNSHPPLLQRIRQGLP